MAALIWFIPSVSSHMGYKINISSEGIVTLSAFKLLNPSVSYHVCYKITILCESFVTLAALI